MNKLSRNGMKLLVVSSMILGVSACFDNDDDADFEPNVPPIAADAVFTTQTETDIIDTLPASDANGDALIYEISSEPQLGSVTLTADGTFTYVPFDERTGSDTFAYSVSDGKASPVSGTINITIEALQLSFSQFSRDAFNQGPSDEPLLVNGREFIQDIASQTDYQDLIDGN